MKYDGWYKTLRESSSNNSVPSSSNTDNQKSGENRPFGKDYEEIALEGLFATYDLNEIKLSSKKGKIRLGMEADDDFGSLGGDDLGDVGEDSDDTNTGEDFSDDTGDDDLGDDSAFGDMGSDDFDSFGDDTSDYADENGDSSKKGKAKKISRKDALNEDYDQSTQIRETLEFPKKFQALRNIVASNMEIALSQAHVNPNVERTIHKVGEKYQELLKSLDLYTKNMSSKLYEDLFADYIEFHTIAKSLKLSYEALIAM